MSSRSEQILMKSEDIPEESTPAAQQQLSPPLGEDGSSSTYSMKDEDNASLTDDNSQEDDYDDEDDDDENGSKRGKKKRKSHSETKHRKTFMSIDVHAMRSCLHLNQKDAAKKLNVSLSTLKRRFYEMRHELGCDKWPYPPHSKGSTPTPSSSGKRKSSSTSSSDDEEEESSDEQTMDSKPYKTRRQSVTSTKRNSIHNEDSTSNMTTENHNKSATSHLTTERGSKKLKTAHTGFLSSVPDYKQSNSQNDNSDFVFYKDMYEERSSEDDNSSTEMGSDEEYTNRDMKKKTKCDLSEISKKAQSIENPREKEIYGAAVLLIALKQEQIIPNLD